VLWRDYGAADINRMSRHAVFSNVKLIHSGEPDSLTGTTSLSLKSRVLTGNRNSRLSFSTSELSQPLVIFARMFADFENQG